MGVKRLEPLIRWGMTMKAIPGYAGSADDKGNAQHFPGAY